MQITVYNFKNSDLCERDKISLMRSQERGRRIGQFHRNIDCRYFEAFKRLRNKFKESYGCSQEQCPVIRERMIRHMITRHGYGNQPGIPEDDSLNPLPNDDSGLLGRQNLNKQNLKNEPSTHTCLSAVGTSKDSVTTYRPTDYYCDKTVTYSDVSDTNRDTLKIKLKDELVNIFEETPQNPKNKEAILTTLADDLSKIIPSKDFDTDKIKAEIDKGINKLLVDHPATKSDQYKLVPDVRARLFNIVKDKYRDIIQKYDGNNVDLADPIKNLFKNYPIHNETKLNKEDKDNLLNNFVEDINQIARNTKMANADKKAEIEKILNNLHTKYPELDGQEIEKYKKEIRDELFNLIEDNDKDLIGDKRKDLTDPIKKMFKSYPIHNESKLNKEDKDNLLNDFVDDINRIARNTTMANAGKKAEIEKILNNLHTKYPELDGQEIEKYKKEIRDELFNLIEDNDKDLIGDKRKDFTDTIKKMFKSYPIHNESKLNKEDKDNLLNDFVDDINRIARNTTMANADKKAEIEKILNNLHTKYPELDGQEIEKYKKEIRDELFDLIEDNDKDLIGGKRKDLTDDIKKLFKNYPIHTETKLSKVAKDKLLNNFIDDLNQIAKNTTMTDAEKKGEIEKILDDLHSNYPELTDTQEINEYKKVIRNELFDLIEHNGKYLIEDKGKDKTEDIKNIFKNYPIHTETKLSKVAKDELLNNLINDINHIAKSKTIANANKKIEIEELLENFHSKYPKQRNDKDTQEQINKIKENLFDLVKVKPKRSEKKLDAPNNNAFVFSGPSSTGPVTAGESSGEKRDKEEIGFGTGAQGFEVNSRSSNVKRVGVSARSYDGMNFEMAGNRTTKRFYGGGKDNNDSEVCRNGAREVNSNANNTSTIGNGIGPNDGKFGGYSVGFDNGPRNFSGNNDNGLLSNNLSQEVTQFFKDHPIFNQSPQHKDSKEKTIRNLVDDVNKLAANNKLSDDDVVNEVEKLVEKVHIKYPGHKLVQAVYKNNMKDKLCNMINEARIHNIRISSKTDRNNEAGTSKGRPENIEYDLKKNIDNALKDIAIYPKNKDEDRDNVVKNIFDDISWIAVNIQPDNDDEINDEIERALNSQYLWYPGAKRDQTEYRNDIKNRLFNIVKEYHRNKPTSPPNNDYNKDSIISVSSSSYDSDSYNTSEDIRSIKHWVNQLKHERFMIGVDTDELTKCLINRIIPILKLNNCCGKEIILKGALLEIFNEIPISVKCDRKLQRLVNEFVNNLYCKYKKNFSSSDLSTRQSLYVDTLKKYGKSNKLNKLKEIFDNNNIAQDHDFRNEVAELIMVVDEDDEPLNLSIEYDQENYIQKILENKTIHATPSEVINTYKNIMKFLNNDEQNDDDNDDGTFQIYTLDTPCCASSTLKEGQQINDDTSCCANSTPKKTAREVQKLNDEEIRYINNLSNLIRAWMETLPVQFNSPEERSFKDAVVAELAGEIMDNAKEAQITPHTKEVMDKYKEFFVYKWLYKLHVFDKNKMPPYVQDFLRRLEEIPVPVLTRSQRGTRQAMDNIKVRQEQGWEKDFLPKGIDVLEDEISIWVDDQPLDMFNFSKESRNNKIHNLAEAIQSKLKNRDSESGINYDIEQWLKNNVRMDKCRNIVELKNSLKGRVIKLPGDATILADYEEKERERAIIEKLMEKMENEPEKNTVDEDTMDIDRTMKDFIEKFVDHHYDVDDPLAIRTFNYLLKNKLQRMNPPVHKEESHPYSNEALSPQKLYEELELVKTVSDWLKSIPVEKSFHTVGNKERINLVLDLTSTIRALEDEREADPEAMDHNSYLASVISSYFVNIPIKKEYATIPNHETMCIQLLHRVEDWRELIARKRIEKFHDTSGINDENLGDFIEDFIRHHGTEIANDEVKIEAWSIRLLREIKKIVQNAPDPKIVTKTQVYNKLASVPIPGDDTVDQFDKELVYIEEITCWMKNIPLLPYEEDEKKREEEDEDRRIMICDLAETMVTTKNLANNANFKEYLKKWIHDLPLDKKREINIPFLSDQLIRRIERLSYNNGVLGETKSKKDVTKTSSRSNTQVKYPKSKDPGTIATDAIEKWSNSLPIKLDEETKGSIQRKLYQKVSKFNSDPIVFRDDLLYQTLLTVEVDEIVENFPKDNKTQKTMEQQNKELVKSLVDARKMAKEKGAGDDYKHRLERTIDASIPNPVTPKRVFDPAFEIYKSRLADMFILDNFDYSNDEVKIKYERKIKDEIDKYFNSAEKRNTTRLTKHEINNELYSALFKVSIPNEKSVMDEVEQIKTRCIIDFWLENLPLIHIDNLNEQLDFDKKVETLAKRIHEIEQMPKSDEKLKKKILKWLTEVPLEQGEVVNIEEYTDTLLKMLKDSKSQRKCLKSKQGKGKTKSKHKKTKQDDESQIPGPSSHDVSRQPSSRRSEAKSADVIVDIVEQWSNTIPFSSYDNIDTETMRNDVVRKVLIKISFLNSNPDIFANDYFYKHTLDEQLEKILNEIPKCCEFEPDEKAQIKSSLIEALIALKPLIRKEKNRVNYKHDLSCTVDRMLEIPENLPCNKRLEFQALKEDIVENFVQIHYDKDDYEGRQEYKEKIHDAVIKFFTKIVGAKDYNSQMRMNQLLSELAKVPVPNNEVLRDEVEEIRMKNDITEFFDVNNIKEPKHKSINVIKTNLAKKLCDIEKTGHNRENDDKMKNEITRTLKKVDKELKSRTIEGFVNKLKANESKRKKKLPGEDTVFNKNDITLKPSMGLVERPCDNTCPNKFKSGNDATQNENRIMRNTNEISCNEATCPNQIAEEDTTEDRNKRLQTDPIITNQTQTQESGGDNRSTDNIQEEDEEEDDEEEEDEHADLPARMYGVATCPCQWQMRQMWRHYMAAARWRCKGADDPFCIEGPTRVMGPNMMALLCRRGYSVMCSMGNMGMPKP